MSGCVYANIVEDVEFDVDVYGHIMIVVDDVCCVCVRIVCMRIISLTCMLASPVSNMMVVFSLRFAFACMLLLLFCWIDGRVYLH